MEPTKPVAPPDFGPKPVKPVLFDGRGFSEEQWRGRKVQDLIITLGRGLTTAEELLARSWGVDFGSTPAPVGGPVDRSGFDLGGSEGEGDVRVNTLPDGEYTYLYTIRPETKFSEIYVMGVSGTQILEANGKKGDESREHKVPPVAGTHTFVLRVKSVGNQVGVQLRQN